MKQKKTNRVTIALIGGDGAGKSTIATMLRKSLPIPLKYIYMGISMDSSNIALPVSRLIQRVKKARFMKSVNRTNKSEAELLQLYYKENRGPDKRGKLGAAFRLLYRFNEECFRLLVSQFYKWRGYTILYDRHFVFDYPPFSESEISYQRLSERLHRAFLQNIYPKPDLTIMLDAPPEVLFERKGEYDIQHLKNKREAYLRVGYQLPHFVQVDATQPVEKVLQDVMEKIMQFTGYQELAPNHQNKAHNPNRSVRKAGLP